MEVVLLASVSDVRPIASMLRALNFAPRAMVEVSERGIMFIVEEGRSVQANAYLTASIFENYTFNVPQPERPDPNATPESTPEPEPIDEVKPVTFEISLSTLLECLNIFGNAGGVSASSFTEKKSSFRKNHEEREVSHGSATAMRMSYAGIGEPLILLLEESGTITRCEIVTYEPDLIMELGFDADAILQKLIMKSEWLRDAFNEIDSSSERLTLIFSAPDEPMARNYGMKRPADTAEQDLQPLPTFRLEAVGTLGSTEMDYPNDKDVLEYFECADLIKNTYKFSHIQLTLKALAASSKVSIRTGVDGVLSFQFMIPLSKARGANPAREGFVEFLCLPLAVE